MCTSRCVYLALPAVQGLNPGPSASLLGKAAAGPVGLTQPLFINTAGRVLAVSGANLTLPRQLTPQPAPIVSGSLLGGLAGVPPHMASSLGEASSSTRPSTVSPGSLDGNPHSLDGQAHPSLTPLHHLHNYSLPSPSDLPSPALGPLPLGDLGLGLAPSPENWPHLDPSSGELPISKGNKVYMCTFFHFLFS